MSNPIYDQYAKRYGDIPEDGPAERDPNPPVPTDLRPEHQAGPMFLGGPKDWPTPTPGDIGDAIGIDANDPTGEEVTRSDHPDYVAAYVDATPIDEVS